MLKEAFDWWTEQMLGLLPERLSGRGARRANALVADIGPAGTLTLSLRRNGRETSLGQLPTVRSGPRSGQDGSPMPAPMLAPMLARMRRRPAAVLLRVHSNALLERQLAFPLAAERDLDRILRFEMDRVTPFAPDEVFWTWTVERRDRPRNRVLVRLCVVPKAGLLQPIADLQAAGLAPTALEAPPLQAPALEGAGAPAPRVIGLGHAARAGSAWQRRSVAVATGTCAVLAAAVVMVPFVRQSLALRDVDAAIAALRPRVDQAEALRRRLATAAASVDVIAAQRAKVGDALATLAAVTEILPDDTYLTELTLAQRKLELHGQSTSAARLIAALAADPAIRNPAFTAPVTRNDAMKADLFAIQAEISP